MIIHILHKDDDDRDGSSILFLCCRFEDVYVREWCWLSDVDRWTDTIEIKPTAVCTATCEACVLIALTNPELIYNETVAQRV